MNATQVAGSAAERGSRSVSRNRGLTQLQDEQPATGSATAGPVTQIAPSSTQMAQDSTVTQGRKSGQVEWLERQTTTQVEEGSECNSYPSFMKGPLDHGY